MAITFVDEIVADIEWRVSELATLKSLPIRYSFRDDHKELQIKYTIPAIYAIWEGFVKNCFSIYSNHLNSLAISRTDIALSLLTHQLDSECDFNNPRINFDAKKRLVNVIDSLLTNTINIKPSIPTESNVNFKVLNKILERFCIDKVDETYEQKLNKLLLFRNKIAHGENSISVNMNNITELFRLLKI
ncbi:MAE_28990/MAE_18760 family HEPN-like nuclease [Haoranjiania flava]|uniref:MAE_28990/MAE_18760 family HEPN-like nuclease n=1 Tax=Haoranjiania flava TaxID=1856322 RepID=A0AAE3IPB1_9BACT|nr:MAE_28990/MAE_18760 family HEPN-like nuclease [Haoranjiania flava]MCU7695583.1 MAE_28990/MAE_18760 family HEPN-like nuclease [Haoranjiania flava]